MDQFAGLVVVGYSLYLHVKQEVVLLDEVVREAHDRHDVIDGSDLIAFQMEVRLFDVHRLPRRIHPMYPFVQLVDEELLPPNDILSIRVRGWHAQSIHLMLGVRTC